MGPIGRNRLLQGPRIFCCVLGLPTHSVCKSRTQVESLFNFSLAAFFLQPTLIFKHHDCELFFLSSVSAAESLRSTCGAERGAPDCSKQPFPEATPHVGQGTERTIFGARSFFFIGVRCAKKCCKAVRIETF